MYIVQSRREKLLDCMPKGGRVAEIGVYTGNFSERIFAQTCPMELHLIDPWEFQEDDDYKLDDANVPQEQADRHYEIVCNKFAPQIEAEVVKVHRDYSENVADAFPDEFFDWIYIDANHTYEACLSDLRLYAPKVKSNGFVCGHDYANHASAQAMQFGVVEAVNQFVCETGYDFTLLTHEPFPTYVISKSVDHDMHKAVINSAIVHCGIQTEVRNAARKIYQQLIIGMPDGQKEVLYSFD